MIYRLALGATLLAATACASLTTGPTAEVAASRQTIERAQAVRSLEQQIENAVSLRDADYLDSVTAPTFARTNQEGKVEDRATVMALIRKPPPTSDMIRRTIDPVKQQVQLHGDIAVTRGDLEVRGPRRAYRTTYSRVYRWQKGRWLLLSDTTIAMTPLTP